MSGVYFRYISVNVSQCWYFHFLFSYKNSIHTLASTIPVYSTLKNKIIFLVFFFHFLVADIFSKCYWVAIKKFKKKKNEEKQPSMSTFSKNNNNSNTLFSYSLLCNCFPCAFYSMFHIFFCSITFRAFHCTILKRKKHLFTTLRETWPRHTSKTIHLCKCNIEFSRWNKNKQLNWWIFAKHCKQNNCIIVNARMFTTTKIRFKIMV